MTLTTTRTMPIVNQVRFLVIEIGRRIMLQYEFPNGTKSFLHCALHDTGQDTIQCLPKSDFYWDWQRW